jgi:uncharacterized protein (DUF1697 family)
MPRYAAFMRGINLGKARRVSAAALCEAFGDFEDVAAFRASGNVVFSAPRQAPTKLEQRIENAVAKKLGFDSAALVRSEADLRRIAEAKPFPAKAVSASDGKLQVLLLKRKPTAAGRKALLALANKDDKLVQEGKELYWLPKTGIRDSKIATQVDKLHGPTTIRTKGTMEQMYEKFFG